MLLALSTAKGFLVRQVHRKRSAKGTMPVTGTNARSGPMEDKKAAQN